MTAQPYDLIVRNGYVVDLDGRGRADIGVRGGRIAAIGDLSQADAGETLDATGLHVLPGVIDTQVHFREPGLDHKEDLASGSRAAVLGGVVGVFEMPNTKPPTTTPDAIADKLARASGRMWCDFAFYGGATGDNAEACAEMERMPGCAGIKIFMGASTGSLLVEEDEAIRRTLAAIRRRAAIHAEDEFRLRERADVRRPGDPSSHPEWRDAQSAVAATTRVLAIARELGRRIHVLHVTTAGEMALLADHKDVATVEVTPQHLTLVAPECYGRLGTHAQMNPPIRDEMHRQALWRAVSAGVVDVLGSDHAPHTRVEKAQPYPDSPSGMPGVQTLVPVMLDHVVRGRLTLERFIDLTSAGPARIFGMVRKGRIAVGYDADLTLVDLGAERVVEEAWLASRCGWSPFEGARLTGWPMATLVRGRIAARDGELVGNPSGQAITFQEALVPGGV